MGGWGGVGGRTAAAKALHTILLYVRLPVRLGCDAPVAYACLAAVPAQPGGLRRPCRAEAACGWRRQTGAAAEAVRHTARLQLWAPQSRRGTPERASSSIKDYVVAPRQGEGLRADDRHTASPSLLPLLLPRARRRQRRGWCGDGNSAGGPPPWRGPPHRWRRWRRGEGEYRRRRRRVTPPTAQRGGQGGARVVTGGFGRTARQLRQGRGAGDRAPNDRLGWGGGGPCQPPPPLRFREEAAQGRPPHGRRRTGESPGTNPARAWLLSRKKRVQARPSPPATHSIKRTGQKGKRRGVVYKSREGKEMSNAQMDSPATRHKETHNNTQ